MNYNQNSNLYSKSGYSMPFEEKKGRVEIIKPYGENPEGVFNHGVDFKTRNFLIAAVADGCMRSYERPQRCHNDAPAW